MKALFVLMLGACAGDSSFVYTVELPRQSTQADPLVAIAGHVGPTIELVFDSYEQARTELSLVVTVDYRGASSTRELAVRCSRTPDPRMLQSERVWLSAYGSPPLIVIDTYTCVGEGGGLTVTDCGCLERSHVLREG